MRLSRHVALPLPSLHHHLHRHSPCRDRYLPGVQALARSLQAVGAAHPLLVMHTPDTLSAEAVAALHGEPGCEPLRIQRYRPPGAEGAALSGQGGQEWRRAGGLLVKRAAATAAQQLGGRARQPATGRCCTPLESARHKACAPPPCWCAAAVPQASMPPARTSFQPTQSAGASCACGSWSSTSGAPLLLCPDAAFSLFRLANHRHACQQRAEQHNHRGNGKWLATQPTALAGSRRSFMPPPPPPPTPTHHIHTHTTPPPPPG